MIARLVLVLMLLAGGLPGMVAGAPCHEPAVAMATMPDMPAPHGHPAPAEHRCIGCVPLPDVLVARLPALPIRAPLPRPAPVSLALRAAAPPTTPPPRIV